MGPGDTGTGSRIRIFVVHPVELAPNVTRIEMLALCNDLIIVDRYLWKQSLNINECPRSLSWEMIQVCTFWLVRFEYNEFQNDLVFSNSWKAHTYTLLQQWRSSTRHLISFVFFMLPVRFDSPSGFCWFDFSQSLGNKGQEKRNNRWYSIHTLYLPSTEIRTSQRSTVNGLCISSLLSCSRCIGLVHVSLVRSLARSLSLSLTRTCARAPSPCVCIACEFNCCITCDFNCLNSVRVQLPGYRLGADASVPPSSPPWSFPSSSQTPTAWEWREEWLCEIFQKGFCKLDDLGWRGGRVNKEKWGWYQGEWLVCAIFGEFFSCRWGVGCVCEISLKAFIFIGEIGILECVFRKYFCF